MSYDFSGRVAVVTGGTGVLGSEMARALAGCGASVVLIGRNLERAQQLAGALPRPEGSKARHLAVRGDVVDRPSIEAAAASVQRELGRVDFLVNGAGGNDP